MSIVASPPTAFPDSATTPIDYAVVPVVTAAPTSNVPELPLEPLPKRMTFLLIAIGISIAYLFCVLTYWTPSHQGVDQNGYLVGGKMFAQTLSMSQAPVKIGNPKEFDPHQFVADMWVSATNNPQYFYPKYPLGLPLLYAIALWVGGSYGVAIAHLVSPCAMALTVFGVFILARQFTGSFPAILAMLVFATSPTTEYLVNNPNSHATTVFCVVWGMVCILHWWRRGGILWALVGGFLTGYAATIRYTEGAMLLPLLWAAFINLRWRTVRGWMEAAMLVIGWLIPVVVLLTYNWFEMGTLTGYDATNESVGFSWNYFYDNWETILRQLSQNGLFLIFPISIAGLLAMFWWNWRMAVLIWLWVGPCLTIYTFYYWAPDGLGYLRFVLTILPPMLVGGFWLIAHIRDLLPAEKTKAPAYLLILVFTFGGLGAGILGFWGLRLDLLTLGKMKNDKIEIKDYQPFIKLEDYLDPNPGYLRAEAKPVFYSSLVLLAAWGAVFAGSALLKRAVVPTVAAGVVAFLSIGVQADNSFKQLEKDNYARNQQQASYLLAKKFIPEGSVLICRETGFLHHMQFAGDYFAYTGMTFDKGWVNNRSDTPTDEAVLIDPARNLQLKESLKSFDQNALNEQARNMVRDALANNRRVFVFDAINNLPDMLKQLKEKKEGQVPEFVRRYINRPKDDSLKGERLAFWNVPQVVTDDPPPPHRGRRDVKPAYRGQAWQIWEIKAKA